MSFRGKDPFTFVEAARERPVQVLLHPLHYTDAGQSYPEIFADRLRDIAHRMDEEFLRYNRGYAAVRQTDLVTVLRQTP
jgi:hypothetical protein